VALSKKIAHPGLQKAIITDHCDLADGVPVIEGLPMVHKQWNFIAHRKSPVLDMFGHPAIAHACHLEKCKIICKPADTQGYIGAIHQYVNALSAKTLANVLHQDPVKEKKQSRKVRLDDHLLYINLCRVLEVLKYPLPREESHLQVQKKEQKHTLMLIQSRTK
jgi:hypothetical protein